MIEYITLILLKTILEFFRNKTIINFNYKNNLDLTREVFLKIIKLPYNFYRSRTTGDIISRFNDLEKIETSLLGIIINSFVDISLIIISGLFIYSISHLIFFIVMFLLLFYILTNLLFKRNLQNNIEKEKLQKEIFNSNLIESITGFETIKGLNIEEETINKLSNSYDKYLSRIKTTSNNYSIYSIIKNFINDCGNIFIIFIAVILIKDNYITIGELLIINLLISYFLDSTKNLFENSRYFKETMISIRKINELYYDENKNIDLDQVKTIKFLNTSYKNKDERYILKKINLTIKSGEKIMIMGKSGSGKSTLLKLIKNYYTANSIYINDKKISTNKNILYVSQNEILFTDTLYNNITLGQKIDSKEFKKVVDICKIDEIVKDKDTGYNMLIEENGFNISGGEKQRIVLARTLLLKFDIILLDESLSEIDVNLERIILKRILQEYHQKTILLVSHRNNNLDLFEKLYLVDNKKIEIIKRRNENDI